MQFDQLEKNPHFPRPQEQFHQIYFTPLNFPPNCHQLDQIRHIRHILLLFIIILGLLFWYFVSLCSFGFQQVRICLPRFQGTLKPGLVPLMLLPCAPATISKTPIFAICMSQLMHYSWMNLVICRLANCESQLAKSFCRVSCELPGGTGGGGRGAFYCQDCVLFLPLTISLPCH